MTRSAASLRLLLLASVTTAALACDSGETTEPGGQAGVESSRRPSPPNVLIVVLDTTRADAVSAYGDARAHTPHLDRLAAEGVLFKNARATSSWTLPTHATIFTGLHSFEHNAHHETDLLEDGALTLAEILAATHTTAGFSENPHIIARKGFAQGFEVFEETWRPRDRAKHLETVEAFTDWFSARDRSRPFFAFVNLFTPHLPYAPPPRWQQRFFSGREIDSGAVEKLMRFSENHARLYMTGRLEVSQEILDMMMRLYMADTAYADERMEGLLAVLRAEDVLDDTLIVAISDHGENIGEHGLMEHQFGLYETVLRVPMILRLPGKFDGDTRFGPVQLTDVAPTVLEVTSVGPSLWSHMTGLSLVGGDPPNDRPLLAEYMLPVEQKRIFNALVPDFDFSRFDRRLKSLQVGDVKLIASERGELELYDLASDPGELQNLVATRTSDAVRLQSRMMELVGGWVPREAGQRPDLDQEALERLRSLGYVK
jgi:arylsulfatase A-like enzyme